MGSKPKVQKIQAPDPPPAPPTVDQARQTVQERDRLRRRRGRASTVLLDQSNLTATKQLLG